LFLADCFDAVADAAIDNEDPWSVFACPTQPLITFSIVSPALPVPPVQVCFTGIQ